MKKLSKLWATIKTNAERVGIWKPTAIQPPTEYQRFVAGRALKLLVLMEAAAQQDDYMKDMVRGMKTFLEDVVACNVNLPSRKLSGWTWYFLYENPERLDLKFPEICLVEANLSFAMMFRSFEKLHLSESKLRSA